MGILAWAKKNNPKEYKRKFGEADTDSYLKCKICGEWVCSDCGKYEDA